MKTRSPKPDFTIDKSGERIDLGFSLLAVMLAIGIMLAMAIDAWTKPEPAPAVQMEQAHEHSTRSR